MAHYHCHVRPGPKGSGAEHAQYIERGGRFTPEKYGEIGEHERGNLPAWAKGSAARFFAAADEHERANGNSYREFELALPVELSDAERGRLVREFVTEQIGDRHAYAWAIHEPKGHNPHVHVMYSERLRDGIERGPEQYFKRANGKQPERGGHRKSDRFTGREGPEAVEAVRARWAEMQNQALERAGVAARVDHRSLAAQGIEREAMRHRGPAVSGIEARGEVSEVAARREAERLERVQGRAVVEAEVRVVTRQELALERVAVRERRELAAEVTGPERELVLPRVEADRREQLGRAQAMAERRVDRRQGPGIGGQLKEKLLSQARRLRARIGAQLTRVKAWVRERFPDSLERAKGLGRSGSALNLEEGLAKGPERLSVAEQQRQGREKWLAMREAAKAQGTALTPEQQRAQGREEWLKQRALGSERTPESVANKDKERDSGLER